jgi:DNA-binding PadR family transcriptional regulator/ribosomal protein S21
VTEIHLTPTSYLVLGLIALEGRATPYDLKRHVAERVGQVWSFPHAQLYTEPARLTAAGLLEEERERGGRNRRYFVITAAGRSALMNWLSEPTREPVEIRDPGLLRLFFSDLLSDKDLKLLARGQQEAHRVRLHMLESLAKQLKSVVEHEPSLGPLRMGVFYEKTAVNFWREIAEVKRRRRKDRRKRRAT